LASLLGRKRLAAVEKLYDALLALAGSPAAATNRAVAAADKNAVCRLSEYVKDRGHRCP